jgi:hypothetical protein
MPEPIYIRNWSRTVPALIVAAAIGAAVAVAAYHDHRRETLVGAAIIEALVIVMLVRTWRAGVLIADDRIVVRNLFRGHALRWSEVAAFSPAWDDPQHHTVGVRTVDDRRISAYALRSMFGWSVLAPPTVVQDAATNVPATRLAEQVEQMLARHGTATK